MNKNYNHVIYLPLRFDYGVHYRHLGFDALTGGTLIANGA